jgi:translation initiation factor 5B
MEATAAAAAAKEAESSEPEDDWETAAAKEEDLKENWDADSEDERAKAVARKAANGK